MGFLDRQRRSSDALGLTDTDCFILSRARFDAAGAPAAADIFEGLARVLAMRLRFTNKELRALRSQAAGEHGAQGSVRRSVS